MVLPSNAANIPSGVTSAHTLSDRIEVTPSSQQAPPATTVLPIRPRLVFSSTHSTTGSSREMPEVQAANSSRTKKRVPNRLPIGMLPDRKSTRLNSSHVRISYAVFCLKKKKTTKKKTKNKKKQ